MPGNIEKRKDPRYRTNVLITFRLFNFSDCHQAKELNHSNNGICFENSNYLKSGTIIHILRENCPKNCNRGRACESCRTTTLATIQWCKQNKTAGAVSYSIGAKYFPHNIGY